MSHDIKRVCIAVLIGAASAGALGQDRFQARMPAAAAEELQQAKALLGTGLPERGISSLTRLTESQPNYFAAQYNLGLALAENGKSKEAIAALERARLIRETEQIGDATIYNSLGWAYMLDGQLDKAEKVFNEAKRNEASLTRESKVRLYNNLGWLYVNTGRTELAKEALQTAEKSFGSAYASRNVIAIEKYEAARAVQVKK